jgi:hypothetical protein
MNEEREVIYVEKIGKAPADNELTHFQNSISAFFGHELKAFSTPEKIQLFGIFFNNVKLDQRTNLIQSFKKDNIGEINKPSWKK